MVQFGNTNSPQWNAADTTPTRFAAIAINALLSRSIIFEHAHRGGPQSFFCVYMSALTCTRVILRATIVGEIRRDSTSELTR